MPTYEYECKECGHNFEVFQYMKDDPLKECPECGKEVRRLIHGGAGVIFKGSGFYVTDKGKAGASALANSPKTEKTDTTASAAEANKTCKAATPEKSDNSACKNCPNNTSNR